MERRSFIRSLTGGIVALELPGWRAGDGTESIGSVLDITTQTVDAFADTLIPGAKRYAGDVAVAGAMTGPSGADVGYVSLLRSIDLGMPLDGIATLLNGRAAAYALVNEIPLPPWHPPFVSLPYAHRLEVVGRLFRPSDPDRDLWIVMALLSSLAFDAGGSQPTAEAIRSGHRGLSYLRFPIPAADGLWRYTEFSYRRQLADEHPRTSKVGQPL